MIVFQRPTFPGERGRKGAFSEQGRRFRNDIVEREKPSENMSRTRYDFSTLTVRLLLRENAR